MGDESVEATDWNDDELTHFVVHGAHALPATRDQGIVQQDGARIWYASYGSGAPVILLHGGLGHGGNWGFQVPALIERGYRAILIDSRGHGRSTRDARPFAYEEMARDVLAVMNTLALNRATLVGWSDGACVALVLAAHFPERISGVFFFACNMDPGGAKPFQSSPILERCFKRHAKDYADVSATPEGFEKLVADLSRMQRTQPDYSADDLALIRVPVAIVHSEGDEFIHREHAEYLARTLPRASLTILRGVTHFAPLQRPALFNTAMLAFVQQVQQADERQT